MKLTLLTLTVLGIGLFKIPGGTLAFAEDTPETSKPSAASCGCRAWFDGNMDIGTRKNSRTVYYHRMEGCRREGSSIESRGLITGRDWLKFKCTAKGCTISCEQLASVLFYQNEDSFAEDIERTQESVDLETTGTCTWRESPEIVRVPLPIENPACEKKINQDLVDLEANHIKMREQLDARTDLKFAEKAPQYQLIEKDNREEKKKIYLESQHQLQVMRNFRNAYCFGEIICPSKDPNPLPRKIICEATDVHSCPSATQCLTVGYRRDTRSDSKPSFFTLPTGVESDTTGWEGSRQLIHFNTGDGAGLSIMYGKGKVNGALRSAVCLNINASKKQNESFSFDSCAQSNPCVTTEASLALRNYPDPSLPDKEDQRGRHGR